MTTKRETGTATRPEASLRKNASRVAAEGKTLTGVYPTPHSLLPVSFGVFIQMEGLGFMLRECRFESCPPQYDHGSTGRSRRYAEREVKVPMSEGESAMGKSKTELAPASQGGELAKVNDMEFAILKVEPEQMQLVLAENIGPAGFDVFALDRIGIPAGGGQQWTVPTLAGPKMEAEIRGVIVYWQDIRVFWAADYDGSRTPPDCSSQDCFHGVGNPGGLCGDCHYSEFGSAGNDTKPGQACNECRRLFLIVEDERLPVMVSLPPTSLGPTRKYFQRLASRGMPYYGVVTTLSLTKDKSTGGIDYSKAALTVAATLREDQVNAFRQLNAMFKPTLCTIKPDAADIDGRAVAGVTSSEDTAGAASEATPMPDPEPEAAEATTRKPDVMDGGSGDSQGPSEADPDIAG